MFCPECATQNLSEAKFCRACGTNLEVFRWRWLRMADRLSNLKTLRTILIDSLAKRRAGMRNVVHGSILLIISALVGLVGFLISTEPSSWLPIWSVFFGWMAGWGAVTRAIGSSKLLEAKLTPPKSSASDRVSALPPANPAASLPPLSIPERTTRHLEERK